MYFLTVNCSILDLVRARGERNNVASTKDPGQKT